MMEKEMLRDARAFLNITRISLTPEREGVLLEPGLRAWDQADGPSIGQGADMKLHSLILADISRKSNLATQGYQGGVALLPAACCLRGG